MANRNPGPMEIEIKLRVPGVAEARRLLRGAGFRLRRRRAFESNILYDTPGESLRRAGKLLRIRVCGNRVWLTWKGPSVRGRHKIREEIELSLRDPEPLAAILERLGLFPGYRYEKYRSEYERPGEPGSAVLDETPIGVFLELEGEPDWIDRHAARLGFRTRDYIRSSYATLYLRDCQRRGLAPGHMVFALKD